MKDRTLFPPRFCHQWISLVFLAAFISAASSEANVGGPSYPASSECFSRLQHTDLLVVQGRGQGRRHGSLRHR